MRSGGITSGPDPGVPCRLSLPEPAWPHRRPVEGGGAQHRLHAAHLVQGRLDRRSEQKRSPVTRDDEARRNHDDASHALSLYGVHDPPGASPYRAAAGEEGLAVVRHAKTGDHGVHAPNDGLEVTPENVRLHRSGAGRQVLGRAERSVRRSRLMTRGGGPTDHLASRSASGPEHQDMPCHAAPFVPVGSGRARRVLLFAQHRIALSPGARLRAPCRSCAGFRD